MPLTVTYILETVADTSLIVEPVAVNATHTITIGTFFPCDATSGAFAITLPPASDNPARILIIKKIDSTANAVTITRAGSDTIDGATTQVLASQYDSLTLVNDETGSIWHIV